MQLARENCLTRLVTGTDDERDWLAAFLTFEDGQAHWAKRDPSTCLFDHLHSTFPSGLAGLVVREARAQGLTVELEEQGRCPAAPPDPNVDLRWLYGFQRKAVKRSIRRTRGILWMTTGAGKTEIMAGICRSLPGVRWLILVHKRDLLDNAMKRLRKRTGEAIGSVGDGLREVQRITVATYQSLNALQKARDPLVKQLLEESGGIIVDECHIAGAQVIWSLIMGCRAYWRFGLSGTPLHRTDQRSILTLGAIGPVIYRVKAQAMQDAGILAKPIITMVEVAKEMGAPWIESKWRSIYLRCVVKNRLRNDAVVEMCRRFPAPRLVFVKLIRHGRRLLARLERAGHQVEFVWGQNSTEERNAAIQRLSRGDIDTLICSDIFDAGVDIPAINSGINAAGGKSAISTIQKLGRAMRSDGGRKTTFHWGDFWDIGHRFVERHARARRKAYLSEGHEVTVERPLGPLFDRTT